MTLPAWLIDQLEQERKEREAQEQREQLRLPLYEEDPFPLYPPKEDGHSGSIVIQL